MSTRAVATLRSVASTANARIIAAGRVNTIGLAERELNQLLDRLDSQNAGADQGSIRRDFARWPFRVASVALRVVHPGGTEVELRLACRNISRGGASLLHNGFFHSGTVCRVLLPRVQGGTDEVSGVICRCTHWRGTLHELGVKFDQAVDLKRFVKDQEGAEVHSFERVAPGMLKGRLLLVEDCQINARVITHFLRETELQVTHVTTAAEALAGSPATFDIVLVTSALSDLPSGAFVAKLREMGIESPVLMMESETSPVNASAAAAANIGVLTKPLQHDDLLRSLAERLLIATKATTKGGGRPVSVVAAIGPELLAELQRTAAALRAAATEKDLGKAMPLCLMLKGAAGAVGHLGLSAAAANAAAVMTNGSSDQDKHTYIDQLCRMCDSVFWPGTPASQTK